MKKYVPLLAITLTLFLLLSGCAVFKDTNGPDDYSLQSLTETDILKGASCVKTGAVETRVNDSRTFRVNTMHGVETLETFSKSGSYTLELSSEITKGNARLVLCTKEQILHDFDLNSAEQSWTFTVEHDTVFLRIAGEDCSFSVNYTVYRY